MEHALHLSVGHLVKEIGLKASHDSTDENGVEVDSAPDEQSDDMARSLSKALGLTKQVSFFALNVMRRELIRSQIRMSPQARAFFESTCEQVGITPLGLILWIRTRWASLYQFLDRFISLRKVFSFHSQFAWACQ